MTETYFFWKQIYYHRISLSSATTPYRCVAKLKPTSALIQIQQQQSIQVKLKLLRERYEKESSNSEQQKDAGNHCINVYILSV